MRNEAPLYVDAFELNRWIHSQLGKSPLPLARSICGHALRLLGSLTLALKDRDRWEKINDADENLILLRTQVRLAVAISLLRENQGIFVLDKLDVLGRQLGGWTRSLECEIG